MPIYFIITIIISFLIFLFSLSLPHYSKSLLEVSIASKKYECGLDILNISNKYFPYLKFFLLSFIFLLFDLEIIILLPIIKSSLSFSLLFFISLIFLGIILEYSLFII